MRRMLITLSSSLLLSLSHTKISLMESSHIISSNISFMKSSYHFVRLILFYIKKIVFGNNFLIFNSFFIYIFFFVLSKLKFWLLLNLTAVKTNTIFSFRQILLLGFYVVTFLIFTSVVFFLLRVHATSRSNWKMRDCVVPICATHTTNTE